MMICTVSFKAFLLNLVCIHQTHLTIAACVLFTLTGFCVCLQNHSQRPSSQQVRLHVTVCLSYPLNYLSYSTRCLSLSTVCSFLSTSAVCSFLPTSAVCSFLSTSAVCSFLSVHQRCLFFLVCPLALLSFVLSCPLALLSCPLALLSVHQRCCLFCSIVHQRCCLLCCLNHQPCCLSTSAVVCPLALCLNLVKNSNKNMPGQREVLLNFDPHQT